MKPDELYWDFYDDPLELKYALKSIINDEDVINEALKNYFLGKEQDMVYAEQIHAKGGTFLSVDKIISTNIKKRASARPSFNNKLRKALIKSQGLPDKKHNYHAHHIVAKNCTRSRKAAQILQALGIDLDDPANGVFLPANEITKQNGALKSAYIHNPIHTKPYYANVNFQITQAYEQDANKEDMKRLLKDIANDLKRGTYPIYHYIPGAERF